MLIQNSYGYAIGMEYAQTVKRFQGAFGTLEKGEVEVVRGLEEKANIEPHNEILEKVQTHRFPD